MAQFMFRSRLVLGVGLALLLLTSAADAARQAVPAGGDLEWAYTPTIKPKAWNISNICTGGWNNSTTGCLGWTNTTTYACEGDPTYIFRPASTTWLQNTVDSIGFILNLTVSGLWALTDAGNKIVSGLGGFNENYCINGTNATAQDITEMQAEMSSINLTTLRGKGTKYVPTGQGSPLSITGDTEPNGGFGRIAKWKAGNRSVNISFTSATEFDNGVHYRSRVVGGSLELGVTATEVYANQSYPSGNSADIGITAEGTQSADWSLSTDPVMGPVGKASTLAAQGTLLASSALSPNLTGDYIMRFDLRANILFDGNLHTVVVGLGSGNFTETIGGCEGTNWCDQDAISFLPNGIDNRINASLWMVRDGTRTLSSQLDVSANNITRYWRLERVGATTTACFFTDPINQDNNASAVACMRGSSATTPQFNRILHAQAVGQADTTNRIEYWLDNTVVTSETLVSSGVWNSSVIGNNTVRAINWTITNNTGLAGTSWQVWQRSSNTSFLSTANDVSPAWSRLALSSDGINNAARALDGTNFTTYTQFRINLTGDGTNSPSIGQFTMNYTKLPNITAAIGSNLTFARPYRTWVDFNATFSDEESGRAQFALNNSTETGFTCSNATVASGNGSVFCIFQWNHTADGGAPSFCGWLEDDDNVTNGTNCSAPVTTDNEAPDVQVAALVNTSSPTFTPSIHRRDNSSGLNRTWLNLYNMSNSSGDANFSGNVTVASGNASITLCTTCYGQIRVSAQADDALPAADRFISAFSNRSFYWDPLPILSAAAASPPRLDGPTGNSNLTVVATENFTTVVAAYVVITAPQGVGTINRTMALNGDSGSGTWNFNFVPTTEFGGGAPTGEYTVQFQARDTGTADLATLNTTVAFGGTGATGDASGAPGGGGAGGAAGSQSSRYGTPAPSPKAPVAGPGPGIACPQLLAQTHIILPQHGARSTWAWNCRTLSPVSGCDVVGERVEKRKGEDVLTGARDPWWSCAVEAGGIALRYSVPTDQINTSSFFALPVSEPSWNTFAKVTVRENGNSSTFDVRLHVTNAAASVQVPLPGPVVAAFALLAPMSAGAVLLAGAFVAVGWRRVWPEKLAYLWFAAAAGIFFFGIGTVGTAAGGARVGGPLLGWVGYAAFSILAWAWVKSGQTAKLRAFQRLAGERLAR